MTETFHECFFTVVLLQTFNLLKFQSLLGKLLLNEYQTFLCAMTTNVITMYFSVKDQIRWTRHSLGWMIFH